MDGAPFIIPLVALLFPILLILAALFLDAVVVSWFMYRIWHDRGHPHAVTHPRVKSII